MKFEQSLWTSLLGATNVFAAPAEPTYADCPDTSAGGDFNSKCAAIASTLAIEHGTVHFSEFVAAGTNLSLSDNDPTCESSVVVLADICRIALSVATSNSSGLNMEAWLPSNWTGRFLSGGNGGLNGCVDYASLAYTSSLGFSSVGTNNGHNGTSGLPFFNKPEVLEDFAYRAMHTGVVTGKQITEDFYGKPHDKSYYLGCSTGGRQGFKSAQDFPDDFDGIISGAPALAFNNLTSWSGHFYTITGPANSSTFVTMPQWVMVHEDVLKQCDELDGYADGIIEDPRLCEYDPAGLTCAEGSTNSSSCLTPTQVETVRAVFAPLLNAQGDLVYPRFQPGPEVIASAILFNGQPFPYTTDWFRYAIYNDPNWDPSTLNTTDYDNAARINPYNIQTWKGDLSGIQNRGSKVIHWHGAADMIISYDNSPRYYEHVSSTMGLSPSELDDFYRFFTVSGTGHCSGGSGAHAIGQASDELKSLDPKENILMALVDWVENGNAPESLVGTKFVNDTVSLGVEFQRAHCKYPKRNQYKGTGDVNAIESWECVDL
ncbi:carboxylic ester hydrolase [Parastagonospora nodorum]|nr:carboxylic ester hydrolase [Parastagonospora nodorum]QRD02563.1 carboxylic ester hydrolase [Parastagonospora nodorum SN15]KAH3926991.1 carboxylic ester hydrolase [Parastagonospora nodorum]KAH3949253.1 carboxylic ester hydrolase [Parastagonospora nodorum]KAH3958880.1 carboxylic ester hydrolase [Parastagonospora nodorum]